MNVLAEILDWSTTRPLWQRDALRRILTQSVVAERDIEELAGICKSAQGLVHGQQPGQPLNPTHLPVPANAVGAVNLDSLTHITGVNALASGQTVTFGPSLTVIYGANAAGKSGYTRILKRACRARGAEQILGNCLVEAAPNAPRATLRLKVGDDLREVSWTDGSDSLDLLSQINVFDSHCAAVYVKDRTDVAFRPFGLDVFDKLSAVVEGVKRILEREQRQLVDAALSLPTVAADTAVSKLLSGLSSLTAPADVANLATLSEAEKARLDFLRKRSTEVQATDPRATARMLDLRARRFRALAEHLSKLDKHLGATSLAELRSSRAAATGADRAAADARDRAFADSPIASTGSEHWQRLWEAARALSVEEVYAEHPFPHTELGASCLLCQRPFDPTSAHRMRAFEEYVQSNAQRNATAAASDYHSRLAQLKSLEVRPTAVDDALRELSLEAEELARRCAAALDSAETVKLSVLLSASSQDEAEDHTVPLNTEDVRDRVSAMATNTAARASELTTPRSHEDVAGLKAELQELDARAHLSTFADQIVREIERRKRVAAYELCLKETNTSAITRKSTDVTKATVTDRLTQSFSSELRKLDFSHVEVDLQSAGGSRGALYHKLVLRRAQNVSLPNVVSEGEARALSIAAFFAELSTAENPSGIIFDDPVSSLDHTWRERVADRLCQEAKDRQVIVFTHDVVFLLALNGAAERLEVEVAHQYIRRDQSGAGVCLAELPWVAMKVKQRIGVLNARMQTARKLASQGMQDQYEREAAYIYGLLRETWERCVEEILVGGVVERYRQTIQTQQIRVLAKITDEDCAILQDAMTKTSRWLPGHDQAPAENVTIPNSAELEADIQGLVLWVKKIADARR